MSDHLPESFYVASILDEQGVHSSAAFLSKAESGPSLRVGTRGQNALTEVKQPTHLQSLWKNNFYFSDFFLLLGSTQELFL